MPIFFFLFDARPTAAARNAADLGGAHVYVFVQSATRAEGELMARSHLMDYAWQPATVLAAAESTPGQLADLDKALVALRRKAEREGIASQFVAWPRQDRTDGLVDVRSLGKPVIDDGKEH